MGDQLVGAGVIDARCSHRRARSPSPSSTAHTRAGLVRAVVRARDVVALRRSMSPRHVLGLDGRERFAPRARAAPGSRARSPRSPLAVVVVSNIALGAEQVARGPAEVLVFAPHDELEIDQNGIFDAEPRDCGAHVVWVLRRLEPRASGRRSPADRPRRSARATPSCTAACCIEFGAAEVPELDQHRLAALRSMLQLRDVAPRQIAGNGGAGM